MPAVGDKVRVLPNKAGQPPREGVVTAVSGNLLSIRWSSGEQTSLIPGPGAVTVLGRARTAAKKASTGATKKSAKATSSSARKPTKKSAKATSSSARKPTKKSAKK